MAAPTRNLTRSAIMRSLDDRHFGLEEQIAELLRTIPTTPAEFLALERATNVLGATLSDRIIQAVLEMSQGALAQRVEPSRSPPAGQSERPCPRPTAWSSVRRRNFQRPEPEIRPPRAP